MLADPESVELLAKGLAPFRVGADDANLQVALVLGSSTEPGTGEVRRAAVCETMVDDHELPVRAGADLELERCLDETRIALERFTKRA